MDRMYMIDDEVHRVFWSFWAFSRLLLNDELHSALVHTSCILCASVARKIAVVYVVDDLFMQYASVEYSTTESL